MNQITSFEVDGHEFFRHRGIVRVRAAHGQPNQLVIAWLEDGSVLFYDRPRMITGRCVDEKYKNVIAVDMDQAIAFVTRCYLAPDYDPRGGLRENSWQSVADSRATWLM